MFKPNLPYSGILGNLLLPCSKMAVPIRIKEHVRVTLNLVTTIIKSG